MTRTEIFAEVQRVVRDHLNVQAPLKLDTQLQRDLALDSLRQLTFVVELENCFRICFDSDDEHGLETLGDVVALVQRRLSAQETRA